MKWDVVIVNSLPAIIANDNHFLHSDFFINPKEPKLKYGGNMAL